MRGARRPRRPLGVVAAALFLVAACAPSRPVDERKSQRCVRCHLADYLDVKLPVHEGIRPRTCATCHSQRAWSPSELEHSWKLDGAHLWVACGRCHRAEPPALEPVFEGLHAACIDCHRADYDRGHAAWPVELRFGTGCAECHDTRAFRPAHDPRPEDAHGQAPTPKANRGDPPSTAPRPRPHPHPHPRPAVEPGPGPGTVGGPTDDPAPAPAPERPPAPEPAPRPARQPDPQPEPDPQPPPDTVTRPSRRHAAPIP
jgi:hypothetical protein